MDVKTLCLGMLSLEDACGYEIKKNFETLFQHFYSAGYGSIYPALAELADAGLVTCRSVPQDGRPDRKVYSITGTGRKMFLDALHSHEPRHKLRSEFLAMMHFAELMDPGRLDALLDDRLRQLRETEAHITGMASAWGEQAPVGARFTAGFGATLARVAADYIETHRHMLSGPARPPNRKPAAKRNGSGTKQISITGNRL